ncbi:hypothetical protein DWB58_22815, partial [candidate division KSB1 bacterium]|nr:hypothetical protein [candidate division KSB1 bacterium]
MQNDFKKIARIQTENRAAVGTNVANGFKLGLDLQSRFETRRKNDVVNFADFIETFVDTGLGNSAYLIGSHATKKGILIDPLRDVDRYLSAAS